MITDFFFIIEKKKYKCYASAVSSFSPIVCDLINNNQFSYDFETLKDPNGDFEELIKLINGFEIDITISNAAFLNEISKILQIQSLFKATDSFLNSIRRTPENNLTLLESYVSHEMVCPEVVNDITTKWENYETLIEIPKEGLLSLSVESLEYLFSKEHFQQNKNEKLFELILKIIEQNGQEYSRLFSFCDPTKLTSNQISKMIEIVTFDYVPQEIIDSFEQKFIQGANSVFEPPSDSNENRFLSVDSKTFKFTHSFDESHYNGIFHYIQTYSSTVFDKFVQLSCGSDKARYLNTLFQYNSIEQYHWDNYTGSNKNKLFKNAWIIISFPYHKIRLEDYTFVVNSTSTKNRPKSWTIFAKNHNDQPDAWQKIDEKKSIKDFSSNDRYIKTFTVSSNDRNFYSQFKIHFTENHQSKKSLDQEIALFGLEFYGTITRI